MKTISLCLQCLKVMIVLAMVSSCSNPNRPLPTAQSDESGLLLQWFTDNGNWVNSAQVPAVISADEVSEMLKGNTLVIDLRNTEQFAAGHIPKAINVQPEELMDFLDNRMDINAFEKVIFVCGRGQLSAWTNGIVRLLGYTNTFSMRFGMCAWDTALAAKGWDLVVDDKYASHLVNEAPQPLPLRYELPVISTGKSSVYEIAHQRATTLLAESSADHFVEFDSLFAHFDDYFIINYWSPDDYEKAGHLPSAWQFSPRQSLSAANQLKAIPNNRKVLLYCYTGHHSAHVLAYLRMLGYDAYSLLYGANAFMHSMMRRDGWPASHQWGQLQKRSYPVSSNTMLPTNPATEIKKAAKGGC
jgi:rhodanese-related sulfurtransferase